MANKLWNELAQEIFEILKESAKEYLKEQGVKTFLKETSERYAMWKWKAVTATNPAKKVEYEQNLRDVIAQAHIEAARHAITANKEMLNVLIKIAITAGNILLKIAPKLIGIPI